MQEATRYCEKIQHKRQWTQYLVYTPQRGFPEKRAGCLKTRRYRKALGFDICYQEIEKNLGKMYDPVIGRFVLDNWDKVITVLQKDENSPEVLIQ